MSTFTNLMGRRVRRDRMSRATNGSVMSYQEGIVRAVTIESGGPKYKTAQGVLLVEFLGGQKMHKKETFPQRGELVLWRIDGESHRLRVIPTPPLERLGELGEGLEE